MFSACSSKRRQLVPCASKHRKHEHQPVNIPEKSNFIASVQLPPPHKFSVPFFYQNICPWALPILESQVMLGACVTIVDCNCSSLLAFDSINKSRTPVGQETFLDHMCVQQQPAAGPAHILSNIACGQRLPNLPNIAKWARVCWHPPHAMKYLIVAANCEQPGNLGSHCSSFQLFFYDILHYCTDVFMCWGRRSWAFFLFCFVQCGPRWIT